MEKKLYPNIEAERARQGMTTECLSKKMGVCRRTLYSWIYRGNIPQSKLELMANIFNVTTDYLLSNQQN